MQDHKQRYREGRNQAHWKDSHGAGRDPVRVEELGSYAAAHCHDQIRNSKQLPEDETPAVVGIGQLQGDEWRCRSYRDVAPACGQGQLTRQDVVGVQNEEHKAGDSPCLHKGQRAWI